MSTPDHIPAELSPARGKQEMRALVAILTGSVEMLKGQTTLEQYAELIGPIVRDTWPVEPLECIPALNAICLRLCTWVAEAYDLDGVEEVLQMLAADIEGPNVNRD